MESATVQATNKNCIDEMDSYLKDLKEWKDNRNVEKQTQDNPPDRIPIG